jgi:hypothetical protein
MEKFCSLAMARDYIAIESIDVTAEVEGTPSVVTMVRATDISVTD